MSAHLNRNKIQLLFENIGLTEVKTVSNLTSTFSNDVQIINDKYILKSWDIDKIKWFKKELFCITQLQGVIPIVPKIIYSDEQGDMLQKPFIIIEKLPGETLIETWEGLIQSQKEEAISKICLYLKEVAKMDISSAQDLFPRIDNWQEWIRKEFEKNVEQCITRKSLTKSAATIIKKQFNEYYPYLKEQKMQVMYYDIHFGNFLVNKGELSGMIDFERTEWVSLDYSLNWIRRMQLLPEEYTKDKNPDTNKFINVMGLFKKYYPEIFAFDHLEERLKAYALLSDLRITNRIGYNRFS